MHAVSGEQTIHNTFRYRLLVLLHVNHQDRFNSLCFLSFLDVFPWSFLVTAIGDTKLLSYMKHLVLQSDLQSLYNVSKDRSNVIYPSTHFIIKSLHMLCTLILEYEIYYNYSYIDVPSDCRSVVKNSLRSTQCFRISQIYANKNHPRGLQLPTSPLPPCPIHLKP